jgi:peptidoglycan/LPS O-acetylase OafA/YrhL
MVVVLIAYPLLTVNTAAFSTFGGTAVLAHVPVLQSEALMFPSLIPKVPVGFGVDGPVWSLSVEACFYLTLPFVARAFYRRPVRGLMLGLAFSALCRWQATHIASAWLHLVGGPTWPSAVDAISNTLTVQFPYFVGDFAVGMFVARTIVSLQRRTLTGWELRLGRLVGLAGLVYLAVFEPAHAETAVGAFQFHKDPIAETLVPLALGALIVGATLTPARALRPLTNRVIVRLSEVSYGTYLYHVPLRLLALVTLGLPADPSAGSFLILFAFVAVSSCFAGWLSYVTLEWPIRRRAQVLARRYRRVPPEPAASAPPPAEAVGASPPAEAEAAGAAPPSETLSLSARGQSVQKS